MRWFSLLLVLLTVGCGSSEKGPELVPYSGIVSLDGQPLPDAVITFHPQEAGKNGAFGQTNESGEFTLTSGKKPGIIPGSYKVTISRIVAKDGASVSPEEGMDIEQLMMSGQASESIPEKYSSPQQTQLTADITESPDTPPSFELTSS
ncbi:hypothetical protein Mal4_13730 [Maioricimonas rarisocia]|uniref:Carboxypeptidase regulatory-like domain-containing protein n=1 Tax=Maioricimonas rarisocia TaxID=2528026 RepID=A0A517Z3K2_9PLAN|nr:carboxypeptidase-like regulatory domain-containing protein [Maioricimonas rarisocia]QDU37070.1 hypothetical protein Mal4_13730 [Maioricimonas rarisocia]